MRLDISSNTSEPFIIKEDGIEGGKDWPGRIVPRKDWKNWQKVAETSNVNCSGQEHDEANCGRPLGMAFMPGDQVWSLTEFYYVDFSQSRIGVNKCVFYKHTIRVCVSCC